MNKKGILPVLIIVAVIVLGAGAYALMKPLPTDIPESMTNTTPQATSSVSTTPTAPTVVTITYSDTGFAPNSVSVKKGTKVMFVNESKNRMWVGSDEHPDHTGYNGTAKSEHCPDTNGIAFDQCSGTENGGTYSFTFNKTGSWPYHNHALSEDGGTIVVTE